MDTNNIDDETIPRVTTKKCHECGEVVIPALKKERFPVMIGLEEAGQAEAQFGAILEALAARLAGQPLYGLFPGKKLLRSHRAMLAKLGFLGGAYYL